ncbi:MAG: hypothetical protein WCO82_00575 [Sphingomonadales bacterium]|jgi:hypothetical protein
MRLGLALLLLAAPAAADVLSPAPDAVSVSIYRPPGRGQGALDLDELQGFALISEQRTVTLAAGRNTIRFAGVADGMLAASASITGLPAGVAEQNRDAKLLSPGGLIQASIGQPAELVRTHARTGKEQRIPVTIRAREQGVMLQTPAGLEALGCSGLPERLVFPKAPPGLNASPTLSVEADAAAPVTATITLTYLARDFDWAANYVAELAPDGQSLALFGWITLANGNATSFKGARTQVLAGRVEHDGDVQDAPAQATPAARGCWPLGKTGGLPRPPVPRMLMEMALPAPPAPMMAMAAPAADIVVTGARKAVQEDFGDLQLYRIPDPTDVRAQGQKQVAFVEAARVPVQAVYRFQLYADSGDDDPQPAQLLLRTRNTAGNGLGQPLPAGTVALFSAGARPMLLGEAPLRDTARDEEVELPVLQSPQVQARHAEDDNVDGLYRITLTNARSAPAQVEVVLDKDDDQRLFATSPAIGSRNGRPTWRVTVPAGGQTVLRYRVKEVR